MNSFDAQPMLADQLVRLRPLHASDWPGLFAAASDPAIWTLHPAHDRWQEPVFRAFFDLGLQSGGTLVIEDAVTGAMIGSSRYDTERAEASEVEIGWTFLARGHWGGAANRAVKRLMIGHALTMFERVIFLIGETNVRSRRALEKIGGTLTARQMDLPMNGQIIRHVIYAIDRAAFAAGPLMDDRA
jgi:N-acetyltransferase